MKTFNILLTNLQEKITGIFPERLAGKTTEIDTRYRAVYSAPPGQDEVQAIRRFNVLCYIAVIALFAVGIIVMITGFTGDKSLDDTIPRNDYGGASKRVEAQLEARYHGDLVKRDVSLSVRPKQAEAAKIAEELQSLKDRLPEMILGENASVGEVVSDLNLPSVDAETGIEITWKSSDENVIDARGKINYVEAKAGTLIDLNARLSKGEATQQFVVTLMIGDVESAATAYKESIDRSIDALIHEIESGNEGDAVRLPGETASGVSLFWKPTGNAVVVVIPAFALLLGLLVYRRRYARVDAEVARVRAGIHRDFPEFLAKLLLLLNAGLVITSAVEKTAADYERRKGPNKRSYFYEELLVMRRRMESSNTPLTAEFADLARRSGQKELMRFSAILNENIDKGNELSEKLEQESHMLWELRKKEAEKQGRLAETKLTFPMALQLLTIMLVTVTPAMLNMG